MTARFIRCLVIVTAIHLLAAAVVFGAYQMVQEESVEKGSPKKIPSEKEAFNLSVNQQIKKPVEERNDYKVQPGDSYWEIARKFNTTVKELQAVNGHPSGHVLKVGESLKIPR